MKKYSLLIGTTGILTFTVYFYYLFLKTYFSPDKSFMFFHFYHGRKKHARFLKEVREAEESLRRGFAVLKRDIEAELSIIKKAKLSRTFKDEEGLKETQLLKDFEAVQKYIGK